MRSLQLLTAAMVLALGIAAAPQALAAMYKWVDEQGNVQYSQTPPAQVPSERVAPPPPPPTGSQQERARLQQQLEALEERKAVEGEARAEQDKAAMSAADRAARCEQARSTLATLQSRGRVRVRDAQGVYTPLDETERQAAIAEAQRAIEENCN